MSMFWAFLGLAMAATSPEAVLATARKAVAVDASVQTVRLELVGRGGAGRSREMVVSTRRDPDAQRTHLRFTAPTEVAGTQMVLVDRPNAPDEALLYLPALKKVSTVGGRGRGGSFMGSDFSFEDLELISSLSGASTLISEGAERVVIDLQPGAGSSYSRLRCSFERSTGLLREAELFDAQGAAVKRLVVSEVATVGGRVVPVRSEMANLKNGSSTRMVVLSQRLDAPRSELPDAMFTSAWMESHP